MKCSNIIKRRCNIEKFKLQLSKLMDKYNFEVIEFNYYNKIFGNIVLRIKKEDKELNFVTDRGEIYCNSELLCDYEYLRKENKTTPQKLLEVIELKLNTI